MVTFNTSQRLMGAASAAVLLAVQLAHAQTCPFDSGGSTLENDGLVLTRYALGLRGAPMLANTAFAVGDAATIESNIACPSCGLRVTDDKDALSNLIFTVADATIISRKIAGFSGAALTNGVALGSGTRNTPAAVQSFLLAGCGATGGTVTSVGAGYGLVANGPNVVGNAVVSNGLIELANGYILPQGCAVGQVPKSGGAGSWVCAADNVGSGATNAFVQGGNAFGAPGVLGTTDDRPLTVGTGGGNGLRVIPSFANSAPHIILGSGLNSISTASAVVGATIGGGSGNTANGAFATISGGLQNTAAGNWATVAGGDSNLASGAYSFAAGRQAKAEAAGSFVWADSTPIDYRAGLFNGATFANSFNVRATGGINLVTAVNASGAQTTGVNIDSTGTLYSDALQVTGAISAASLNVSGASRSGSFEVGLPGARTTIDSSGIYSDYVVETSKLFKTLSNNGTKLDMATNHKLGIQTSTSFYRADRNFCWYFGGLYSSGECDSGGGETVMRLYKNTLLDRSQLLVNAAIEAPKGINTKSIFSGQITVDDTFSVIVRQGNVFAQNGYMSAQNFLVVSDRNSKENILSIDAKSVLAKVAALPLSRWNYKSDDKKAVHMGPMAQDFKRIFNLGQSDKTISTTDVSGVALAAIQGLHQLVKEKDVEIAKLKAKYDADIAAIKKKLGM